MTDSVVLLVEVFIGGVLVGIALTFIVMRKLSDLQAEARARKEEEQRQAQSPSRRRNGRE